MPSPSRPSPPAPSPPAPSLPAPSPPPSPSPSSTSATRYETTHVHKVYEAIAPHFASTRYKPWPLVACFLSTLPPFSLGLDLGCGNGKNLLLAPACFSIGSDRSAALVDIAAERCQAADADVIVADSLALPHHAGRWDFVISVAVIHHFSTPERRREAVKGVVELLRPGRRGDSGAWTGGRALVYVWALEQPGSRRGWSAEGRAGQDVMVPWVMGPRKKRKGEDAEAGGDETATFNRYYHLYRAGELTAAVMAAGGVVLDEGFEKDNWWVIAGRPLDPVVKKASEAGGALAQTPR